MSEGAAIVPASEVASSFPFDELTTEFQRRWLRQIRELVQRRAASERSIREHFRQRELDARSSYFTARGGLMAEFERGQRECMAAFRKAQEKELADSDYAGCELLEDELRRDESARQQHEALLESTQQAWQEKTRAIDAAFKAQEGMPRQEFLQFKQQCESCAGEIQAVLAQGRTLASEHRAWSEPSAEPPRLPPQPTTPLLVERLNHALNLARSKLAEMASRPAVRVLAEGYAWGLFVIGALLSWYPLAVMLDSRGWLWIGAGCLLAGFANWLIAVLSLRPIARRQMARIVPEFHDALMQASAAVQAAVVSARADADRKYRQLVENRERDLAAAKTRSERARAEILVDYETRCQESRAEFRGRRREADQQHLARLAAIEHEFLPRLNDLEERFSRDVRELSQKYREQRQVDRAKLRKQWDQLVQEWRQGIADFEQYVAAGHNYCAGICREWRDGAQRVLDRATVGEQSPDADARDLRPAAEEIRALRLGHYEFDLGRLEGGLSDDPTLALPNSRFELPVLLSYPESPSLLLKTSGDGRDVATAVLQNAMLRLLTTFPPGKVRFTIIDPVGLGQNFSAFMHLADFDERLVNSRIWTESTHINQRLTDLTEHMENVIQKYLRNEFASIQEYNRQAGEVAEAFQILVVANFPSNFSDESVRRLASIANSGARCGVYTLISLDSKAPLPRHLELADLQSRSATLVWDEVARRFQWEVDELRDLPVALEQPPTGEELTELVREVGRLAKDAVRVEVPFESIVPTVDGWWHADSREEIEVPLGRAGAKKMQHLRLGRGTSQHVLISGKTGSGKSTLLNAIITSLAIHYAPHELQFYLIDFKKGVEFKAYATHRLPHAQVIAVESEREFGMSVLERLDLELKQRGDLFRQAGVQDLRSFRNADAARILPRILLVIDEFQEFFTTDDKIAHDAALLLDRLVRQGRAFGIHVMLGSQTLAGAYSLARSTISQMAVRIALQCSESDAHLILSEDNTAARLLSRPGEAIYNDANGLLEGNHPFQVVWLPDDQREFYLRQMAQRARERQVSFAAPIVFEGNVAADPADNESLRETLSGSRVGGPPVVWLGSAVAIKEPTHTQFRPQAGANLLIVGQQEEMATGILGNALVALSVLRDPEGGGPLPEGLHRISVLDGTVADSPVAGFWPQAVRELRIDAAVIKPRDASAVVRRLGAEVQRRQARPEQHEPPVYLLIHNLARFRDLKRGDDFGFSSFSDDGDESAHAAKAFATLLREGPALGVHTLIWCDSYNNLNRWMERQLLRELDGRVLFQMSATDSSNLIDSPVASRLGSHTALYYSEEQGQIEKFRPYGVPSLEWLRQATAQRGASQTATQPASYPDCV